MATEESNIVANILIKTAPLATLFKNVRGCFRSMDGERIVQAGLQPKGSGDLIGIRSVKITQDMVGKTIGQFVCIECKTSKGAVRPEQKNYIEFIQSKGGIAGIARSPEDAIQLLSEN
jgi:hypothetical protein